MSFDIWVNGKYMKEIIKKYIEQNKLCKSQSLGAGGYFDVRNTDYMWAETPIYETGFANKSFNEILEYIQYIRKKYSDYKLYPAFYLVE